tara:strand:+ start:5331 stop:6254 length:924 start_codon:yes stop_codon:yes gene_type:complete
MKKIKINFVDFWPNFQKTDNYFYHLLSLKYQVEIEEEDPDIVFFSVDYFKSRERNKYLNHRSKKVFFTGENVRPNFDGPASIEHPNYSIGLADIAFTFDYSDDPRNYRLPLWAFYTDWFSLGYNENRDPAYLVPLERILNRVHIPKSRFCNFLFSNNSGERVNILRVVEQYNAVTCAGSLLNNTGYKIPGRGDQIQKIEFISKFKFTIAAENSKHDGYTTEKMIHPLSVGSIPIYWGSDRVTEEFNEKAFINANKMSQSDLLESILELDSDDSLYRKMINEPIFPDGRIPEYVFPENVLEFIEDSTC